MLDPLLVGPGPRAPLKPPPGLWPAGAAGTAILLVLSFPGWSVPGAAWVALTPWLLVLPLAGSRRRAFLYSWALGFAFFLAMTAWLRLVAVIGWVAISVYLGAYFGVYGALMYQSLQSPGWRVIPLGAALWVGLEYLRTTLFSGFGWFLLGHTQSRLLPVIQVADIAGVYAVSFVLAVFSLAGCLCVRGVVERLHGRQVMRRSIMAMTTACCLLIVVLTYGQHRLVADPPVVPANQALAAGPAVCGIQGNVPSVLERSDRNPLEEYLALTAPVVPGSVDLIVWPESMFMGWVEGERRQFVLLPPLPEELAAWPESARLNWELLALRGEPLPLACLRGEALARALAREKQAALLLGGHGFDFRFSGERAVKREYNSAFLFNAAGELVNRYDKIHLVPFSERLPHPWLRIFAPPEFGSLEWGTRPATVTVGNDEAAWRASLSICFEDTVPHLIRRLVRAPDGGKRADFLINISNDGWFQGTPEHDQHLAIAVFRCVENRLWMLRVANTGISALVDANGRIRRQVRDAAGRRRAVAGRLEGEGGPGGEPLRLPPDGRISPYLWWGDRPVQAALFLALLGLAAGAWKRRRRANIDT